MLPAQVGVINRITAQLAEQVGIVTVAIALPGVLCIDIQVDTVHYLPVDTGATVRAATNGTVSPLNARTTLGHRHNQRLRAVPKYRLSSTAILH